MPKKSTPTRGGAQRNRSKGQKSFELVRPASQVQEAETESSVDEGSENPENNTSDAITAASESPNEATNIATLPTVPKKREKPSSVATKEAPSSVPATAKTEDVEEEVVAAPKGSASARLAARRQSTRRTQQRNAAALITAEHYSYVRKDLIFIAILAAIMFVALIVLYFIPGIGL